jgi:hypothetical protein
MLYLSARVLIVPAAMMSGGSKRGGPCILQDTQKVFTMVTRQHLDTFGNKVEPITNLLFGSSQL